jgi:hypothetical protein
MDLGVVRVLGGCARAHPPDVAPELEVSWRLPHELLFVIAAVAALEVLPGRLWP